MMMKIIGDIKRNITKFSRVAWSSCPYTVLGKKTVQYVRGTARDKTTPVTSSEKNIIMKIKMGRNIALIGFFCPFFWIALLSGATRQTLYFNALHSGIFIAIGLGIVAVYVFRLGQIRNKIICVLEQEKPASKTIRK